MRPMPMRSLVHAAVVLAMATSQAAQAQQDTAPPVRVNAGAAAEAQQSATDLAKKLQNPIGDLYSFPFQGNTNFSYGPNKGTQDILNIQPVIPIHVNADWNIITRTILPLIWQPSLQPIQSVPFGTGPTTFSAFLSPSKPVNGWLWGVGPVVQIPTPAARPSGPTSGAADHRRAGLHERSVGHRRAGEQRVVVRRHAGARRHAIQRLPDPAFRQLQFRRGLVGRHGAGDHRELARGRRQGLDLAGRRRVGRVIKLGGKLPVNLLLGAYYNALRPEFGPTWQLRTQATLSSDQGVCRRPHRLSGRAITARRPPLRIPRRASPRRTAHASASPGRSHHCRMPTMLFALMSASWRAVYSLCTVTDIPA